jgi:hypothetical protein
VITAAENIEAVLNENDGLEEVVGDKGYHSNQSLVDLEAVGARNRTLTRTSVSLTVLYLTSLRSPFTLTGTAA